MPWAKLNATAEVRKVPPIAIVQPVVALPRRSRVSTISPMQLTTAKPSSHPA